MSVTAELLSSWFERCFFSDYGTRLVGGAQEPLYLPSKENERPVIRFRDDYVSSALHEVAHWCIAGKDRLSLVDYGYWYEANTRTESQQKVFEHVEVRPQAVECALHWCCGLTFRVSVDNFSLPDYDASPFAERVSAMLKELIVLGLPKRAERFCECILSERKIDPPLYDYLKVQYENRG